MFASLALMIVAEGFCGYFCALCADEFGEDPLRVRTNTPTLELCMRESLLNLKQPHPGSVTPCVVLHTASCLVSDSVISCCVIKPAEK